MRGTMGEVMGGERGGHQFMGNDPRVRQEGRIQRYHKNGNFRELKFAINSQPFGP
jgi:hypothetical protein